jgi:hypothetical protein
LSNAALAGGPRLKRQPVRLSRDLPRRCSG